MRLPNDLRELSIDKLGMMHNIMAHCMLVLQNPFL